MSAVLTLDEWAGLPEDDARQYELVEGVLSAVPRPALLHQRVSYQLTQQLNKQLPDELAALPGVEVVIDSGHPATVRAPDIVVTHSHVVDDNPPRLPASDVIVAVEIISPGTGRTDKVTKFAEYAEAGIEHYWLVDLTAPVTVTFYQLVDGEYEVDADTAEPIALSSPVPLTINPAALANRR